MAHLLIDGATATGPGASIYLAKTVKDHTISCWYVDADNSITALKISLEGSDSPRGVPDADAKWFDLGSYDFTLEDISAKSTMFHIVNKPIQRVRINIKQLTGAGGGDKVYSRYIPDY